MSPGLSYILGENVQKEASSDSYCPWIVMLNQSAKIERTFKIMLHINLKTLFSQWENNTFQPFFYSIVQMYAQERMCAVIAKIALILECW